MTSPFSNGRKSLTLMTIVCVCVEGVHLVLEPDESIVPGASGMHKKGVGVSDKTRPFEHQWKDSGTKKKKRGRGTALLQKVLPAEPPQALPGWQKLQV